MKERGDFERQVVVTQIDGGYLIESHQHGAAFRKIFATFKDALNFIAFDFGLITVGEKIEWREA